MSRSRIFVLCSAVALVLVVMFVVLRKKDTSDNTDIQSQADVPSNNQSQDASVAAEHSVQESSSDDALIAPLPSNPKETRSKVDTPTSSAPLATTSEQNTEQKKSVPVVHTSPCKWADLKTETRELKGHLHEFSLDRSLASSEPVCVFVDGKSVAHTRLKDGRMRIESRIARASTKVSVMYCSEGVKCQMSCPEPEKDFWETLGSDDQGAGVGFAENETQDEKELQKELKALKDVLNRKPSEVPVAKWVVAAQQDSSCRQ